MEKSNKTGLFFGSFNPIHIGHLLIANYMVEFTDISEVWFVVSPHNPLKQKQSLLEGHHRLSLVNLAIKDNPNLKATNIEFKLTQPSYTINTLNYLKGKYPKKDFILIMGTDNLNTLNKWKNYEQILKYYELYVYPRPKFDGGIFKNHPKVKIINAPLMEISSSFIRKSIKKDKDMKYILPQKVYQYIKKMHFYEK